MLQLQGDVVVAVSELGPQPPDIVLYTLIKTFIVYNMLPSAKRNNISGSRKSKARAQGRSVADEVWL